MTKEKIMEQLEYTLGAIANDEARDSLRRNFLASNEEVQEDIVKFFLLEATQDLIYRKTQERFR